MSRHRMCGGRSYCGIGDSTDEACGVELATCTQKHKQKQLAKKRGGVSFYYASRNHDALEPEDNLLMTKTDQYLPAQDVLVASRQRGCSLQVKI